MGVGKVRIGVILISIGVLLLLNTTGLVDYGFWRWISKLWPVVLIAIGIEKIFSSAQSTSMRRLAWISPLLIVGVVTYAVIAAQTEPDYSHGHDSWEWHWDKDGSETSSSTSSVAWSPGVARLDVSLEMSGGRLTVRGGSDSGNVLVARTSTRGGKPRVESSVAGDLQTIKIVQRDKPDPHGRDQWIVKLTDSLPVDLDVEGGAARMRVDMSAVKVENFKLDAGAAEIDLIFGSLQPAVKCDIDCGAASLAISIPAGAGMRLYRESVLSHQSEGNVDLVDRGSYSESVGFDTSAVKIEMRINSALTSLRLRRASGATGQSI